MSGDLERLQQSLVELRSLLAASVSIDTSMRQRLDATLRAAERALVEPANTGHNSESLTARLGEMAFDFEASHPTLATALGSVIDALGRMGI